MNNDIAFFLAFGFGFLALALIVKGYIDGKVNSLVRSIEAQERLMFDEDAAIRNHITKRLDNIDHELDQRIGQVWREIDSMWDSTKFGSCDKAMSKNYYNSDAASGGCCKTAQEYLKG